MSGHTRIPLHPGLVMSSNNATYSLAGAWACGYACVGVSPLQPVWLEGYYTHTRILLPPWGKEQYKYSGSVLLSHTIPRAVPSALEGLTTGFGMGPGVSLPLWPPENLKTIQ